MWVDKKCCNVVLSIELINRFSPWCNDLVFLSIDSCTVEIILIFYKKTHDNITSRHDISMSSNSYSLTRIKDYLLLFRGCVKLNLSHSAARWVPQFTITKWLTLLGLMVTQRAYGLE